MITVTTLLMYLGGIFVFVLLTALTILLSNEIKAYMKLRFYKKQGIKSYYFPMVGINRYIGNLVEEKDTSKIKFDLKNSKAIVGNSAVHSGSVLLLLDDALLKDFFLKEVDYFKRTEFIGQNKRSKAFFFQGGIKGLKTRSIFTKFFEAQNVIKLIPALEKVFNDQFEEVITQWKKDENYKIQEWKFMDFKPVLSRTFDDLVSMIIFGETDKANCPSYDGKLFSSVIEEMLRKQIEVGINLFHISTNWRLFGMGLSPSYNKVLKIEENIQKKTYEFYQKREKIKDRKEKLPNLLDLMITHNQKMEKEGKPEEMLGKKSITDHMQVFYLGGTDTSKANTTSSIYTLSTHPKIQEKLRDEMKRTFNIEQKNSGIIDYDSCHYLNAFIKESLRKYGPATAIFGRLCVKDCKIGSIRVNKGTVVATNFTWLHHDPEVFPEPFQFDPSRFEDLDKNKEVERNMKYLPFSTGRRRCIGKYFAELVLKILLKTLLKKFELAADENVKPEWNQFFTLEMKRVNVKIRERVNK